MLPAPVEDAIVQLMTYMVENENAALLVPARFLGQLHPHYRELQAALAIQVADEARHIDVFTRRIRRHGREPALSTAGGQASLKSLLDETDFFPWRAFAVRARRRHLRAPAAIPADRGTRPLTRQICRLAARDEARHVALGMSHLLYRLQQEPGFQHQLAQAVEQRFDALAGTSGLNEEVFDALILIAAGTLTPPKPWAAAPPACSSSCATWPTGAFPSSCAWASSAGMPNGWHHCIRAISCRRSRWPEQPPAALNPRSACCCSAAG
ncbi:ferritin-like domain-containing protein [Delftia tsuruhatensis]|uniref:ferritin-like domain-containing protein n=1 Tax=Delftia tsuruhatensis TaxID=180282 RepID=UPI001E6C3151|nr:ferritin-like domain-containing protein [Delftia tsuruhatensis]CAC9681625.1 Uncharacterised protein [Delftia tsuruhatensis]